MHEDADIEREERAIYVIIVLACLPILIALAVQQRAIDGGNVLILILVSLGALGLAAGVRAWLGGKLPRARIHRRR
jgi:hypothetical protein